MIKNVKFPSARIEIDKDLKLPVFVVSTDVNIYWMFHILTTITIVPGQFYFWSCDLPGILLTNQHDYSPIQYFLTNLYITEQRVVYILYI